MKFISYDGEFPNLCSGTVILEDDDGTRYEIDGLESGGYVTFTPDWEEIVGHGDWYVLDWPDGFPEDKQDEALGLINDNVRRGCCGGCV